MKSSNLAMMTALMAVVVSARFTNAAPATRGERPQKTAEERRLAKEERLRKRYIRTGGPVENLSGMKGNFQIVNCQSRLKISRGPECAAKYRELFCSDFRYVPECGAVDYLTAAEKVKELKANAAVFLIDDTRTPALLVAPEERWALVNIGRLATKGCSDERLLVRATRELARGISMVCGTDGLVMGPDAKGVFTPADLEYRMMEGITAEALIKIGDYLPKLGITPFERSTYRRACEEGWAPEPTNDVQRAIFEQVKVDKERGPTKPIKIEPPKQR
ncbi:MAG: hypothetical protein IKO72_01635 [Kiritimatiellae bacterium]|nr:hypothetical protein [Kiritimatiellia bacterium]